MKRPLLLAVAVVATSVALPVLPAQASADVSISGNQFSPGKVSIALGKSVTWTNEDSSPHTSTSDQGFWASPTLNHNGTYTRQFNDAGSYPYHCTFHSAMKGTVRVRVAASGSPRKGWTVRWANEASADDNFYDAQFKRKGTKKWRTLADEVTGHGAKLHPKRAGTYLVRARTIGLSGTSGWSPVRSVVVK